MLGLLKKKLEKGVLTSVCPEADGIAIARIRRDRDVPPLLELCEFNQLEDSDDIQHELSHCVKEHDLDRSICTTTIESGNYSLLQVEAPDVEPEELRAAVRWKIKDSIDFHVDDAVIDVFEIPEQKAVGRNKMMYAVAARSEVVRKRIDQLLASGLKLDVVDIPELALRNIAGLLPEDVGGVVLVYIGQSRGLITITRQGNLYLSRRIESGINSLPDSAIHQGDPDVVNAWLDRIVIEIQRSMDYYESHFSQAQVSALVLTPTAYELPKAGEYLSQQLGIPARQLDVNELIDLPEPIDMQTQANCILAIGAALREEAKTP